MSDTAKATGITGAAQSFEALLAGGDPDLNVPELVAGSDEAPAQEDAEAFEGQIEGDETADVSEEMDAAPEDEAAADEGDAESAQPEVQLVTVKINGKTEQIPLEEAVKGYQRQADYSQKTAALSEEKRSFESERQAVVQERQQYAQLLNALQQQLQTPEPDWQRLLDADPIAYMREKELWTDRQNKLAAAQFETQRLQQVQQYENQQRLQSVVQENRQKMIEAIPQWKDQKRWEADRAKLLDYGRNIGFSDEELAQAYDFRAVVLMDKARRYDELMANRPKPNQPKGPKVLGAGAASNAPNRESDVNRVKQRLAKTGKVADAAKLFEGLLD
jgi:hypothetical protein